MVGSEILAIRSPFLTHSGSGWHASTDRSAPPADLFDPIAAGVDIRDSGVIYKGLVAVFLNCVPILSEVNNTQEASAFAFVSEACGLDMYKGELPVGWSELYQMGTSEYFWQLRRCTEHILECLCGGSIH